ncbi:hypothetical protein [Micromonospora sp. DT47]|uniref:hypothetical protein n=1 Tax=Micromonospora sp. DT47 TaxID=3393431 RepID=UPI003CE9E81C
MSVEAGDRLRGGVLAGAALFALVAGGWWWRAAAPATGPAPAAGSTPPSPDRGAPDPAGVLDGVLAASPDSAVRIRVDQDGRIVESTVLPDGPGDPDLGLPRFTDTMWRERLVLVPGQPPERRESPPDGVRHLLQYRCTGDGELLIAVVHAPYLDTSQTACDGELGSLVLPDAEVATRLDLSAVGPGPIEAEVQLVALP